MFSLLGFHVIFHVFPLGVSWLVNVGEENGGREMEMRGPAEAPLTASAGPSQHPEALHDRALRQGVKTCQGID